MTRLPPPVPERLRPRPSRRRPHRYAWLALLPLAVGGLSLWRVGPVEVDSCRGLPSSVPANLALLEGASRLVVDLEWVRRQAEMWPAVAEVQVQLEVGGRLRLAAQPAEPCASVRVGSGWHGVTAEGTMAGRLAGPRLPVLEVDSCRPESLRGALAVANRIAAAASAPVGRVRRILPDDLEVELTTADGATYTIHVLNAPTAAEAWWTARVAAGQPVAPWADLRFDDRLVQGGRA